MEVKQMITNIWLIVALVTMLEGYVFEDPSFNTEAECKAYATENIASLNLHVNMFFELPVTKINPMICVTKKELDDQRDGAIDT